MQLIKEGPDIPVGVLQALEEDQLVIFCGAGISFPAGLPSFKDLVSRVLTRLGENLNPQEQSEFKNESYDRVFTLVEKRLGSGYVRSAVKHELTIDLAKADLSTHKSILDLSSGRRAGYRIVTTNFDLGFELLGAADLRVHAAPLLPVPKTQWRSLVHLHGKIDDSDPECLNLVLSSGDFGKAYLTERWASRFITELFRRFTVLFVGYSISDPVVRYMMDALAADRQSGEAVKDAYVFADHKRKERANAIAAWKAKNVFPIPFDRKKSFSLLHKTLAEWAAIHRDGLIGKEGIVARYGPIAPKLPYDEAVSQVLWALSERSGHVARVFAELEAEPPLEWLEVFESQGLLDPQTTDDNLEFIGPGAALVGHSARVARPQPLHPITRALAAWMMRHLDKARLVDWVLQKGGCLHPEMREILRRTLATNWSPLPRALSRVWRLLASDVMDCACDQGADWFDVLARVRNEPWDAELRLAVLHCLRPRLTLARSLWNASLWGALEISDEQTPRISNYVDADVVMTSSDLGAELAGSLSKIETVRLSELADEVTTSLHAALVLLESVDKASSESDFSYVYIPSVAPHEQNQWFQDWTNLVEIVRICWEAALRTDVTRGHAIANRWKGINYPIFRRLVFYAMSREGVFSLSDAVEELLVNKSWWLWSVETQHEMYGLLRHIWPKVQPNDADRIVSAILAGPPRTMFKDEIDPGELRRVIDRETWKRLKKLETFGRELPPNGAGRLAELAGMYPAWKLGAGDEDEFPVYSSSWAGPARTLAETSSEGLLLESPEDMAAALSEEENREARIYRWGVAAGERPRWGMRVLQHLAKRSNWQEDVWHAALNGLQGKVLPFQWRKLHPLLLEAPDQFLEQGLQRISWWMRDVAPKVNRRHESQYLDLWDRVFQIAESSTTDAQELDNPVTAALNDPLGVLADALLIRLNAYGLARNAGFPSALERRFNMLTDTPRSFTARVILASRLAQLYAISPAWTARRLIPYFDWNTSSDAYAIWQGYLWVARIYPDLLVAIKPFLLESLRRRERLGKYSRQICQLFAIAAISFRDAFSPKEAKAALLALDTEGLSEVGNALARMVEEAREKSDDMWRNRIGPWIDSAWPKDRERVAPRTARSLLLATIATREEFPNAFQTIRRLLTRTRDFNFVVHRMHESKHASSHPREVLSALDLLIEEGRFPSPELRDLLDAISKGWPDSVRTPEYRRLDEYLRRHGL